MKYNITHITEKHNKVALERRYIEIFEILIETPVEERESVLKEICIQINLQYSSVRFYLRKKFGNEILPSEDEKLEKQVLNKIKNKENFTDLFISKEDYDKPNKYNNLNSFYRYIENKYQNNPSSDLMNFILLSISEIITKHENHIKTQKTIQNNTKKIELIENKKSVYKENILKGLEYLEKEKENLYNENKLSTEIASVRKIINHASKIYLSEKEMEFIDNSTQRVNIIADYRAQRITAELYNVIYKEYKITGKINAFTLIKAEERLYITKDSVKMLIEKEKDTDKTMFLLQILESLEQMIVHYSNIVATSHNAHKTDKEIECLIKQNRPESTDEELSELFSNLKKNGIKKTYKKALLIYDYLFSSKKDKKIIERKNTNE